MKVFSTWIIIGLFLISGIQSLHAARIEGGKGVVVLKNETVLIGAIGYYQDMDLITITRDNRIFTYAAHQALVFQFFDMEMNIHRTFVSVMVADDRYNRSSYRGFMELVQKGTISIFRKLRIEPESYETNVMLMDEHESIIRFDYYYEYNGLVRRIDDFEKQIIPKMSNQRTVIMQWIKVHNLDLRSSGDQLKVLQFYNELNNKNVKIIEG